MDLGDGVCVPYKAHVQISSESRPLLFFMVDSTEHEIYHAYKRICCHKDIKLHKLTYSKISHANSSKCGHRLIKCDEM